MGIFFKDYNLIFISMEIKQRIPCDWWEKENREIHETRLDSSHYY
jgi:hypothetical protein